MKCQNFGHAGDGNVPTNVLRKERSNNECNNKLPKLAEEAYRLSISLGGTISGEHGIGTMRRRFLPMAIEETQIGLMREIKRVFDPNNVLNPDKIFGIHE